MLRAVELQKSVVVLRLDNTCLPLYVLEKQPVEERPDQQATLQLLMEKVAAAGRASLARGPEQGNAADPAIKPPFAESLQRQYERAYLKDLIYVHYSDREARYIPLAAHERRDPSWERAMITAMETTAIWRAFNRDAPAGPQAEEKSYDDALVAYRDLQHKPVRRLALLGEPGAGKSFSLERIAVEYARDALQNPHAPIPLLIPLGLWIREAMSLEAFIEHTLDKDKLGRYFSSFCDQGRAVLLLDAMNEIPPGQRQNKAAQIKRLARDTRFASVVVSCREKDFTADFNLPFDTLRLQPLKPSQILAFLQRMLSFHAEKEASQAAEACFWQLAGGDEIRQVWKKSRQIVDDLDLFWSADDVPTDPNVKSHTNWRDEMLWRQARFDSRGLLRLASNPYFILSLPSSRMAGSFPLIGHSYSKGFCNCYMNAKGRRVKNGMNLVFLIKQVGRLRWLHWLRPCSDRQEVKASRACKPACLRRIA